MSTLDTALLIWFHLDAMFPHVVWNQNQKAAYDITSSYKVYVGWNRYTNSLSSVLDHTLSFILYNSIVNPASSQICQLATAHYTSVLAIL